MISEFHTRDATKSSSAKSFVRGREGDMQVVDISAVFSGVMAYLGALLRERALRRAAGADILASRPVAD